MVETETHVATELSVAAVRGTLSRYMDGYYSHLSSKEQVDLRRFSFSGVDINALQEHAKSEGMKIENDKKKLEEKLNACRNLGMHFEKLKEVEASGGSVLYFLHSELERIADKQAENYATLCRIMDMLDDPTKPRKVVEDLIRQQKEINHSAAKFMQQLMMLQRLFQGLPPF